MASEYLDDIIKMYTTIDPIYGEETQKQLQDIIDVAWENYIYMKARIHQ